MTSPRKIAQFTRERVQHSITTICTIHGKPTTIQSAVVIVSSTLYGYVWIGMQKYTQLKSRLRSHRGQPCVQSWNNEESQRGGEMNSQDPNTVPCHNCGMVTHLATNNAILYIFLRQPWMCYFIVTCPNCGQMSRCFIRENLAWELAWAERNDIGTITEDFPSETEIESFENTYGIKQIPIRDLSKGDEAWVAFFHYLLDTRDPMAELE